MTDLRVHFSKFPAEPSTMPDIQNPPQISTLAARPILLALRFLLFLSTWSLTSFADQTIQFKGYNLGCPVDDKSGNILVGPDMDKDGKPAPEIDKAGNKIEVYCIGSNPRPPRGAFYIKFTPVGKDPVYIGLCKYNWGENNSKKVINKDGVITMVTHTNDEGTTGHRGVNTHDDTTHGLKDGFEEQIEFVYTVGDGKLGLKLSSRPIRPVIGPDGQPVEDNGIPAKHGQGAYQTDKTIPPTQAPNSTTGLLDLVNMLKPPEAPDREDADATTDQEGDYRALSTVFDGTANGDGTISVKFLAFGIILAEAPFPGESNLQVIENLAQKINNVDYLSQQGIQANVLQEDGNNFLTVHNVLDSDFNVASTDTGITFLQIGSTF